MNTRHSEPFYISSSLFDNRRLKRRLSKWMERLRERQHQQQLQQQQLYLAHAHLNTFHSHTKTHRQTQAQSQTERGSRRRCHLMLSRRHVAATLPADITIDLLSDEEQEPFQQRDQLEKRQTVALVNNGFASHTAGSSCGSSLQLSTVPNITLVPVELAPAHSSSSSATATSAMLLMPTSKRCSNLNQHYGHVSFTTTTTRTHSAHTINESIVLTSDEEDVRNVRNEFIRRSPPPLAPLTFSDSVEEVTVSLVPRHTTTANCQARRQRRRPTPRDSAATTTSHSRDRNLNPNPSSCINYDSYLSVDVDVDVASDVTATLPDETTVHTVIANRIYELSLSKLREGLASSGVPEYAHDILPEQLQKLSPAMRAKVAPMVAPSPPAPISLKLSSDLSISLISDDDDCESGNNNGNGASGTSFSSDLLHPVLAAEAHAAAKLLKQQQPQLSVVQHLQYPGHGTPVSLPVMAALAVAATERAPTLVPSTRRRKLG